MSLDDEWSLAGFQERRQLHISRAEFSEHVAQAVSLILREYGASREELAAELSEFTGEDISVHMLNAYSSKARREHPIPAHRLLALVALSGRWDVMDDLTRRFGLRIATQRDVFLMNLGSAYRDMRFWEQQIENATTLKKVDD